MSLRVAIFTDSALPILNGVSVSVDSLIRELRNQRNLTLADICEQFGTGQITISRLERGLTESHDTRLTRRVRDWLLAAT